MIPIIHNPCYNPSMNMLKRTFFITFAKTIKLLSKLLNKGAGTALPGLIIEKYNPDLFNHFTQQLTTTIVITGTNGKTTTKSMLDEILRAEGIKHITNKSGSNLKRGLISTFISNSSLKGKLNSNIAILEVEEATLPKIIDFLKANYLIVTNLFRDQLDAYGEINKTREYIKEAILKSPETQLILNADDGLVSSLADEVQNNSYFFGLTDKYSKKFTFESNTKSGAAQKVLRPEIIELNGDLTTKFEIKGQEYKVNVPGIFHVYNALASLTAANLLNINESNIQKGFNNFKPAFGRGEVVKVTKESLTNELKEYYTNPFSFQLFLIKNPAGFTLTLELLKTLRKAKLLIIINDNTADGRDVSWLWDSKVEKIQEINSQKITVSGKRAEDMALRLKYSFDKIENKQEIVITKSIKQAVQDLVSTAEKDEVIYVLPTYTAMNEFRKILGKRF